MTLDSGQRNSPTLWQEEWWADCSDCDREWPILVDAGEEPLAELEECPHCGARDGAVVTSTWAVGR